MDLEAAAPSSYRLRRKEKRSKGRSETTTEDEGGDERRDVNGLTRYEYEMELLKVGNPYRMNPWDTSVPISIPEVKEVVDSVYPDPELYSL